ncbi:PadR family transcriptional regulator [Kibdelosporangium aridum]|uniref:PadR family transcriptional regulator n=1 Tax=Kibdelosporangium aridum TaxID=2030 RepID=UPI001C8B9ABF|nr:PadR family transcriptional regulator [Kibdelosporangium aridum]
MIAIVSGDAPQEVTPLPAEPVEPTAGRSRKLNATSYVVLGMLTYGPATSYQLKQRVGQSVGNFWAFAHSQLYDEPARLVAAGLVTQTIEEGGRRKRTYAITEEGRRALAEWLAEPTLEQTEVRDTGLLKLFFGTGARPDDIRNLARDRYQSHRDRADGYLRQRAEIESLADRWQLKTLELGMRYERTVEKFWKDFMDELDRDPP